MADTATYSGAMKTTYPTAKKKGKAKKKALPKIKRRKRAY